MYRESQENSGPVCLDNPASQPNYWSFKTRSTRHPQSSQPGLADQAAKLSFASAESLETMSEAELPLGFNRMNRFRQSLPLSRSTSQTKLRSPGVLFLQYGDETRRVHITHEISSMDTLHALIVHMFQQKLTMGMLKSHNTAILIKDESRNVFYELEDVRDIQDRSIIKIYRKEPIYSSFPAPHITNGDVRREMIYSSRDSSPTRRMNSMSPASHLASGSPPPVLQSSSPARSRMSYSGGRPPSFAGSPVHHADRMSGLPPPQGVSPSPSAILERRDVKPDEDLSNKNVVLVKNDGLYSDPYGMVHEGRLSITSTQSLAGLGDPFSYPGGLYKRGSVRSLSTYSAAGLQTDLEDGMYKPNSQIYGDTYGPGLGFRIPPSSPQKASDGRLVEVQQGQGPHSPYSGPSNRSSPVRQTFRKDSSSSVFMDSPVGKQRNPSSSSGNNDIFPGPGDRPLSGFSSPVPPKDVETRERMEAMEKQIASLTGLVQSALMRGSDTENPSEKTEAANGGTSRSAASSHHSAGTPQSTPTQGSTATPVDQSKAITRLHMQLHLHDLQHNASELRNQLQQLKKLQLQNQETVRNLLKRTETEISVRVTDTVRKQEDPLQRQRAMVEEERLKYLNEEELITHQLNDLEKSVEKIKRDLAHNHRLISVQELEEKAMVLKQLGETLTELKAQFPSLQSKMRVVLRVEVEAVKFLKEEPHRLDGLLKRCKMVTDTLAQIRKQVDEGVWHAPENLHNPSPKQTVSDGEFAKSTEFELPSSPPTNFHQTDSQMQSWDSLCQSEASSSSGNPTRGAMVTAKTQTLPDTHNKRMGTEKSVSVEAAERDWEEKRAALTQYSAKDINRLLEETQAELMKAIPDLDFAAKHKLTGSATTTPEHRASKPQPAQKLSAKIDPNGRRGSDELTVPRYRTEKPSKSPPPPPPRRSFPSSHGLTTTRTGEVIVTSKKETTFIKKSDSEELESQKPQVKLRRTVSEVVRPASTPPIIGSGIKDDDDEDRIIAELEVFQRSSGSSMVPQVHCDHTAATRVLPRPAQLWSVEAAAAPGGWKTTASKNRDRPPERTPALPRPCPDPQPQRRSNPPDVPAVSGTSSPLPQIIFTVWTSDPPSPNTESDWTKPEIFDFSGEHGPEWSYQAVTKDDHIAQGNAGESDQFRVGLEDNLKHTSCTSGQDISDSQRSFSTGSFNSKVSKDASLVKDGSLVWQNKDPEEDIAGFMITKNNIISVTTEEKERVEVPDDVRVIQVKRSGGACSDRVAEAGNVLHNGKPVLITFEEPMSLEAAYRQLWEITRCEDELGGQRGFQCGKVASDPNDEETRRNDGRNSSRDLGGQTEKVTSKEPRTLPKNPAPVPKPRVTQTKEPKSQRSSCGKIEFPKLHSMALSNVLRSGCTAKLKVIDVQKMIHSASATNPSGQGVSNVTKDIMAEDGNSVAWRSMDICRNTYQRLDSLEESIRELELTINEIGAKQPTASENSWTITSEQAQRDSLTQCDTNKVNSPAESPLLGSQREDAGKGSDPQANTKPPLLPKPKLPQSGGVSIPPMKMVNPVGSRLKLVQPSGGDKSNKHSKQRMEYVRIPGHQQTARPSKEAISVNETNPGADKTAASRTSIPVLTSFGTRNSSISF